MRGRREGWNEGKEGRVGMRGKRERCDEGKEGRVGMKDKGKGSVERHGVL